MKVVIFTEETGVKLPPINRWTGKYGRGIEVAEDSQIISLLENHNLSVPHDDIEMESQYRKILFEFIRPARSMFAGMFSEVRIFADTLSELVQTNLYVISGRYGLIQETEEIIPYSSHIQTEQDLGILDERTDFSNRMVDAANECNFIILLLPRHYLIYLLKNGWFDRLNRESFIIIISSKKLLSDFSQYNNVDVLERKGVARMGKINREKILEIIKSHSNSYEFNGV